ncbi:armadillo-type protein [Cladochytrium replicatum]|nr:armadillo-type protein [Cladochytrium replicatum]
MDPNQHQTPSLQQLEENIRHFAGATGQDAKNFDRWLQWFITQPYAWELSIKLLYSESPNCVFFGAKFLESKIIRPKDWSLLSPDEIEALRIQLTDAIARNSTGMPLVLSKLSMALIKLALMSPVNLYPKFVSLFCENLRQNSIETIVGQTKLSISHPHVQAASIGVALHFLGLVPEAFQSLQASDKRREAQLSQDLDDALPYVLGLVKAVLFAEADDMPPHQRNAERMLLPAASVGLLQERALQCANRWVDRSVPYEELVALAGVTIPTLARETTFAAAADLLADVSSSSAVVKQSTMYCSGLLPTLMSGGWLQNQLAQAAQGMTSIEIAVKIAQLLTAIGENHVQYLITNCQLTEVKAFLDIMVDLTRFPGYYAEDENISNLTAEFWGQIGLELTGTIFASPNVSAGQEGEDDDCVIQQPDLYTNAAGHPVILGSSVKDNGLVQGATVLEGAEVSSVEQQIAKEMFVEVFRRLGEIVRVKVTIPPYEEYKDWSDDIKDQFAQYRNNEMADLLRIVQRITDDINLPDQFVQAAEQALLMYQSTQFQRTPQVESALFCIKALAENIKEGPLPWLLRLMGEGDGVLSQLIVFDARPEWNLVSNRMVRLIGEYAEQHHFVHPLNRAVLPSVVRFLMMRLDRTLEHSIMSGKNVNSGHARRARGDYQAARALLHLCETSASDLVDGLDLFLQTLARFSVSNFAENTVSQIAEAVGRIIQPLPKADQDTQIEKVATIFVNNIRMLLTQSSTQSNPLIQDRHCSEVKSQLRHLSSFLQGIVNEHDSEPEDLSSNSSLGFQILEVVTQVCNEFDDDLTMEDVSTLIRRISDPRVSNILRPPAKYIAEFLVQLYLVRNTYGAIPKAAGAVVEGYVADAAAKERKIRKLSGNSEVEEWAVLQVLLAEISRITVELVGVNGELMEERWDPVRAYFDMLQKYVKCYPDAIMHVPNPVLSVVMLKLTVWCLSSSNTLLLSTILQFLKHLFKKSQHTPSLASVVQYMIDEIGGLLVRQLIEVLLAKRIAYTENPSNPLVIYLLSWLVTRYPQNMRTILFQIVPLENFPSKGYTEQMKVELVNVLMANRVGRTTEYINQLRRKTFQSELVYE